MQKKMLTRQEFEELRLKCATEMAGDSKLQKQALGVMADAHSHMWLHQSNWMGEPILNTAQDIMAMQHVIFQTKPKYIIEVGVAWAGMLLFYSTLMEIIGGEKIIAIDIYIPEDLKERINSHEKLAGRIEWIEGSSIDEHTINQVKEIVGDSKEILVNLDSHHTHDHVLQELKIYEKFIGIDNYMICGDTIVEKLPAFNSRNREWGPGNNPMTALQEFQKENRCFERDKNLENTLLLSSHPHGYLRRTKES